MAQSDTKDIIYTLIQKFLAKPPVIIWGSGATMPYGMPSMSDLNHAIKAQLGDRFDATANNLEEELGKDKYKGDLPEIRSIIWRAIYIRDKTAEDRFMKDAKYFDGIHSLISIFKKSHPQCLNIITTNYDKILENAMGFHGIHFTDGFPGCDFSAFDDNLFQNQNIVNLIKVHGSLNWFEINGEIRRQAGINSLDSSIRPVIVAPGKDKYRETTKLPYRELIQKADLAIKNAGSFLCVGFGFNDEHVTPEIIKQVNKGTPLVLITKELTSSSLRELQNAERFVFLDKTDDMTRVIFKQDKRTSRQEESLDNGLWEMPNFIKEIFE